MKSADIENALVDNALLLARTHSLRRVIGKSDYFIRERHTGYTIHCKGIDELNSTCQRLYQRAHLIAS